MQERVEIVTAIARAEGVLEHAANELRALPGFRTYPDGFTVDRYTVNETWWREGFGLADGT